MCILLKNLINGTNTIYFLSFTVFQCGPTICFISSPAKWQWSSSNADMCVVVRPTFHSKSWFHKNLLITFLMPIRPSSSASTFHLIGWFLQNCLIFFFLYSFLRKVCWFGWIILKVILKGRKGQIWLIRSTGPIAVACRRSIGPSTPVIRQPKVGFFSNSVGVFLGWISLDLFSFFF